MDLKYAFNKLLIKFNELDTSCVVYSQKKIKPMEI